MPEHPPIPILCGPTASGKTSIVIELSAQYSIEVISADSRQVIRRLDIGTAKPTPAEHELVRFHLIDLVAPGERYTAYRFIEDADRAIRSTIESNHVPIVVGGTGLYLRALTEGVVEIDEDRWEVRDRLERELAEVGPQEMYKRLTEIDPEEAARTHPNNTVRVLRALEIYRLTGQPKSKLVSTGSYRCSDYSYQYFCFLPDRQKLYERIDERVERMVVEGLIEETRQLAADGCSEAIRRSNVIGYNEILDYLDGQSTQPEAVRLIKQNSRRYAKRQITWFRHQQPGEYYRDRESLKAALRQHLDRWPPGPEKT